MLQELIVALIVVVAVAYMAWRYLPAAWRQRLGRVHPGLAAGPGGCGSGGGGGCSSCGGCGTRAKAGVQQQSVAPPAPVARNADSLQSNQ
ncbi:MAG TPA: hypothetical protein PLC50_05335 [Alicycliphilus sp.]|jgi:hypothetical protein|uniref:FeoB-associated Cys-rich membrane protein n=1 Tax=Diaphorobacter limosus TaxID=3036128 RepID=A0ABZ0J6C0_9BURK|nr:hypothetical protein [Diaphorobacter sp. Y-1]MBP6753360.1 hypothetical protein [Alicycliphilus sp.]MBP7327412.1 hypothetical protein [Alicycliphilus sp.]MBP7330270.1 hypothetical protein [Alicycliphilus sp.]MBP8780062.1 hypothetical protein [Alicycliphilus sp.]WOO33809.1 hypothetical protein P4826_07030 [Diaphorobacter sp. Y-1]